MEEKGVKMGGYKRKDGGETGEGKRIRAKCNKNRTRIIRRVPPLTVRCSVCAEDSTACLLCSLAGNRRGDAQGSTTPSSEFIITSTTKSFISDRLIGQKVWKWKTSETLITIKLHDQSVKFYGVQLECCLLGFRGLTNTPQPCERRYQAYSSFCDHLPQVTLQLLQVETVVCLSYQSTHS